VSGKRFKKVTEKLPPSLLRSFRAGNCVAFVGAGFSYPVEMPLWQPLLIALKKALEPLGTDDSHWSLLNYAQVCIDGGQLARAASALREADKPCKEIDNQVRELFDYSRYDSLQAKDPRKVEMSARIKALTSLPWAGVVTTNYDELLGRSGRRWKPIVRAPTDRLDLGRALKSSERPFLVHLHGTVASGGSIVLTEEDYDSVYLGSSTVNSFLRALMLRYTLVFIGTSIEDKFVEYKRELQSLFSDHAKALIDPEFALLASDDSDRGDYLERTQGFKCIYYDNARGKHEGFVGALRQMRDQLVEPSQAIEIDDVSHNLLAILQEFAGRATYQQIEEAYSQRTKAKAEGFHHGYDRHGEVTANDIYYRLVFLRDRHYCDYNSETQEYSPKSAHEAAVNNAGSLTPRPPHSINKGRSRKAAR